VGVDVATTGDEVRRAEEGEQDEVGVLRELRDVDTCRDGGMGGDVYGAAEAEAKAASE
jgi:hypothetical protein